MSSGTFYRLVIVITNVSENVSSLFSGSLPVIGLHSCVTVEALLISLSVEGYYVVSKKTVFWDVFSTITMTDVFWDFVTQAKFAD
jgi:hypothetical protein